VLKALSVAKIVTIPVTGKEMSMKNLWNHWGRRTRRTLCKTCPNFTLPAWSPTFVGLGLNLGLLSDRHRITAWATERSLRMPYDMESHAEILFSLEYMPYRVGCSQFWHLTQSSAALALRRVTDFLTLCRVSRFWRLYPSYSPFFRIYVNATTDPSSCTVWGMGLRVRKPEGH
jgi:hypothetical protein